MTFDFESWWSEHGFPGDSFEKEKCRKLADSAVAAGREAMPSIKIGGVNFHAEKPVVDLIDASTNEIHVLREQVIGRCGGCGEFIQGDSPCGHTKTGMDRAGNPIPEQCGLVMLVDAASVQVIHEDNDKLRAERDALQRQVATLEDRAGRRSRGAIALLMEQRELRIQAEAERDALRNRNTELERVLREYSPRHASGCASLDITYTVEHERVAPCDCGRDAALAALEQP